MASAEGVAHPNGKGATGPARPRRERGFQILDEALLFELQDELMTRPETSSHQNKRKLTPTGRTHSTLEVVKTARSEEPLPCGSPRDVFMENARSIGLYDYLLKEEECVLPPGADIQAYMKARNGILAAWRSNVSCFMSEEKAISIVGERDAPYAVAAYAFLHQYGYINFGISPEICYQREQSDCDKGSVIVVGAGCAGLTAAQQLRMFGYKVVILEARDGPGGRVRSATMQGPPNTSIAVADLGGSVITGIDGHPVAVLARQLQLPMLSINDNTPLFLPNGEELEKVFDDWAFDLHKYILDESHKLRGSKTTGDLSFDPVLESIWERDLEKKVISDPLVNGDPEKIALARRVFDWHQANLEFANAAVLRDVSLKYWDQDDPDEMLGPHTWVAGGNMSWIHSLTKNVPVFYKQPVKEIRYSNFGVAVHTPTNEYLADAVIVTVPLGVLKSKAIVFNPPLTDRKLSVINRMGFGVLNKVILLFPNAFWAKSSDLDMFARVPESTETRGEFFLFYSFKHTSGGAVLTALVAGKAALQFETYTAKEAGKRVMTVLRQIWEGRGVEVPPPLDIICTKWKTDEYARGSYSSLPNGSLGGDDYATLGEDLEGRLFFAGEATCKRYPATIHGAIYSGLSTAANVDAAFRIRSPRPAIIPSAPEPTPRPVSEHIENILNIAGSMEKMFKEFVPDLEFGSFNVMFGPPSEEHTCVVKVDISNPEDPFSTPTRIYELMERDTVEYLCDLEGDGERLTAMHALGFKLSGRSRLASNSRIQTFLHALAQYRSIIQNNGIPALKASPQAPPSPVTKKQLSSTDIHLVRLLVKDPQGKVKKFKLSKSAPLSKLFKSFTDKVGLKQKDIKYSFKACTLSGDSTAETLAMMDGDTINAYY